MSMCRVFSCVVGRECLLWPVCSLGRTLLAFALLHSILQPNLPVTPGVSWLPTFAFQSPIMKRTSFLGVSSKTSYRSPSDQIRSVAQSCPNLCDPMNLSMPGLPVHHQLLEFNQTHIHWVSDAIQPSHPLSSPSPPAPNPSQHQSLFQWVNSLHEVAKVLEFQL